MNEYIGLILFGTFALFLLLKVPVSFSLGLSSLICLVILDVPLVVVGQRIFTALDSFPIMAIPFFILSGNLMIEGGLSSRIVNFAMSLLARIRGGLGHGGHFSLRDFWRAVRLRPGDGHLHRGDDLPGNGPPGDTRRRPWQA